MRLEIILQYVYQQRQTHRITTATHQLKTKKKDSKRVNYNAVAFISAPAPITPNPLLFMWTPNYCRSLRSFLSPSSSLKIRTKSTTWPNRMMWVMGLRPPPKSESMADPSSAAVEAPRGTFRQSTPHMSWRILTPKQWTHMWFWCYRVLRKWGLAEI